MVEFVEALKTEQSLHQYSQQELERINGLPENPPEAKHPLEIIGKPIIKILDGYGNFYVKLVNRLIR